MTDTASLTTIATIPGFNGPVGVAITSGGAAVCVTNAGFGRAGVTDTARNAAGATIPVDADPIGVAVSHASSTYAHLTAPTA
ncbi:hypothetical protein AB0A71_40590 [Kitasatospora aureofaciens]|uniref:hypothetical protein n=1 Tax=Kitasatospora aureofaciens TaxID=1894 RepID=UPI00340435F6